MYRYSNLKRHHPTATAATIATTARAIVKWGAIIAMAASATPAWACGGCFVQPIDAPTPILQEAERVLFARDPATKQSVVWVEIRYNGPASGFGWVLPLPKVPKVSVGTSYLFDRLDLATAPRVEFTALSPEGCGFSSSATSGGLGCGAMAASESATFATAGKSANEDDNGGSGVTILQRDQTGPYDYVVIEGKTGDAIQKWLTDNGYAIPAKATAVLGDHVKQGHVFVGVKLAPGKGIEAIKPIALTMDDAEPCVPLRLTAISAVEDTTVQVYVAGPGRAVPKNHLHVQVNPARLDVLHGASNYPQVLAAAIDEAAGRAFATEFAGALPTKVNIPNQNSFLPPTEEALINLTALDLTPVGKQNSRCGILNTLQSRGFPITRETATILEQHLKLMAKAGNTGDPEAYYQQTGLCGGDDLLPSFDPAPLLLQLEQEFAKPLRDMATLLGKAAGAGGKDGRLSRLVMRISPSEMTKDPVFAFHPTLPDRSNKFVGAYGPVCRGRAGQDSFRVTLKGLGSWIFANPTGPSAPQDGRPNIAIDARMAKAPAALVVELLDETGDPLPIAPGDVDTVDAAIAGARWGQPSLPAGLTLQQAPKRWTPPATDAVVPDASGSANGSGGCTGGLGTPWAKMGALLLAVTLLTRMRRRANP